MNRTNSWGGSIVPEKCLGDLPLQVIENLVETTYSELKALRDSGKLVPGKYYRITDYQCTTSLTETSSAGHQFDIIVLALDEHTLSEDAKAINHVENALFVTNGRLKMRFYRYAEADLVISGLNYYAFANIDTPVRAAALNEVPSEGDSAFMISEGVVIELPGSYFTYENFDYFSDCNLSAWELKYCLDNDTDRFAWAQQSTDMVISNDADYYRRYTPGDTDKFAWRACNDDFEYYDDEYIIYTDKEVPKVGDVTYHENYNDEVYEITRESSKEGMGVIYYMKDEWNNECPYDFKNVRFYREGDWVYTFSRISAHNNILDSSVEQFVHPNGSGEYPDTYGNIIRECRNDNDGNYGPLQLNNIVFVFPEDIIFNQNYSGNYSNIFGTNCHSNTFSGNCHSNTFGDYCYSNTFGDDCHDNTFGNYCFNNTFSGNLYSNTFGDFCYSNTFDNFCEYNIFGNECWGIHSGIFCSHNTFGNGCVRITFGDYFSYNAFGNDCHDNTFGNSGAIDHCQYIVLGDGVQYCKIYGTTTPTLSACLQNIKIAQGIRGTDDNELAISVATGLDYETYVGKNSSGTLVIKNLLDD